MEAPGGCRPGRRHGEWWGGPRPDDPPANRVPTVALPARHRLDPCANGRDPLRKDCPMSPEQHEQHAPSNADAPASPEGPDLDFRPDYWNPADPVTAIVANIKGAVRRGLVVQALRREPGDPAAATDIPEDLREDALEEGDRIMWGRIHPAMMGGEYLPPYLK